MQTNRAYLVALHVPGRTWEQIRPVIDAMPAIVNWRLEMPGALLIVSPLTASDLVDRLYEAFGEESRMIAADTEGNFSGYGSQEAWSLVREKGPPRTKASAKDVAKSSS